MPALSERDYAEFNRMLEELTPEIDNMKEIPQSFMKDMVDKNQLYGERMFVSIKQKAWVERLHEEFIGNTAHESKGDDRDPRSDRDMDNDPPF